MRDGARGKTGGITANARYIVALTAAVGLGFALLVNTIPALEPAYQNRALHVAKETAAALVLLLVAALLFGRFRRSGQLLDLLALAGVVVLAGKALVFSVVAAILIEPGGGLTTWRTTGAGMLGAALLAAGAISTQRALQDRTRALLLTAGGCLGAIGILAGAAGFFDLPAAFTDPPETREDLQTLSQDSALLIADLGASVLFLVAGAAFARRAEQEGDEFELWLAIGSVIAGIGYLNYSLFPSLYTDFLYAGDIFRIAAVLAWGIGTIRVIGAYQAAYAESAVQEERRRVARDLHDGVAQELSFISSQMHWLSRETSEAQAGGELRESTDQIMEAVQRALDESRGAISALSRPADEPLHLTLAHTAEEVTNRLGARLELDLDNRVAVSPAWEEALTRILREAVANAVRHGRARIVNVQLRDADGIWLRITDDGGGFDTSQPGSETGYGLTSMRERTESLGGEFQISSEPGHGSCVEIQLP
jgi:signal transduction histidine kinase